MLNKLTNLVFNACYIHYGLKKRRKVYLWGRMGGPTESYFMIFLGEDMIEWLKLNVDGLSTIAQCEEYASKLLREGWIIQKVDTTSFTRECYYVFGHGVLGTGTSINTFL